MKGAIFDLDGTLLDSMRFWGKIVPTYLKKRNLKITTEQKQLVDAMTLEQGSKYLKDTFNLTEDVPEIVSELNSIIEGNYKFNIPLKPYVHHFLNRMKKKGIKMCIATATDRSLVEHALIRLNLEEYFEFLITSNDVGVSKSKSPKIYESALEKLGLEKEDVVIFEDAPYAVKTAKEAGFYVIGVQENFYKESRDFIVNTVDKYIKNFNEIK